MDFGPTYGYDIDRDDDEQTEVNLARDVRLTRCPVCGCVITEYQYNGCQECDDCRDYTCF